jgi:predicted metalloprotease with PDZ domain
MRDLDTELRLRTKDKRSLDDVARQLSRDSKPVNIVSLREVAAKLAGAPLDAISPEKIQASSLR